MGKLPWFSVVLFAGSMCVPFGVQATDVDGPFRDEDFFDTGDAPNGVPAYPDGTLGRFPFIGHINNYDAWNLWLGWYPTNFNGSGDLYGVDNDPDLAFSDCTETAFGMTFGQDECIQDSTDMCLRSPVVLNPCEPTTFKMAYFILVSGFYSYLNILVDFNGDGDWGDVVYCEATRDSVPEWAIKNYEVVHPYPPWAIMDVPSFLVGPRAGPTWMRISLSSDPMPDTYPTHQTSILGGETEDYPFVIGGVVPTTRMTWGGLKSRYD
jgi:GEVED domain-containing protein